MDCMDPPSGYRNDTTTGIAVGDEAETIYAVVNGTTTTTGVALTMVMRKRII